MLEGCVLVLVPNTLLRRKKNEHLGERELDCKLQKPWCLVQKLSLFSEKFWRKFYLAPRSYFLVVYTDLCLR